jgi:hypothetical protein
MNIKELNTHMFFRCSLLFVLLVIIYQTAQANEAQMLGNLPIQKIILGDDNTLFLSKIYPEELLQQDEDLYKDGIAEPQPERFAVADDKSYRLVDGKISHTQKLGEDGFIWSIRIKAPNAVNLNLGFNPITLPAGTELWIRSKLDKKVIGPYTDKDVYKNELWTPVFMGDELDVIVYSRHEGIRPTVMIERFNKGYTGFDRRAERGLCYEHAACKIGDGWRKQIRSVGFFTTKSGTAGCTGQLVNNTTNDFHAYFLTASHCLDNENTANSLRFYWNHERKSCGAPFDGKSLIHPGGAIFRARGPADFLLLELLNKPTTAANTYMAGWDATGDGVNSKTISIHHPFGKEKAIVRNDQPLQSSVYDNPPNVNDKGAKDHWYVENWEQGMLHYRSSGACLWESKNNRCVGVLHGGYSKCKRCDDCNCSRDPETWYGKLSVGWAPKKGSENSLQYWLNPKNDKLTEDGIDTETKWLRRPK